MKSVADEKKENCLQSLKMYYSCRNLKKKKK